MTLKSESDDRRHMVSLPSLPSLPLDDDRFAVAGVQLEAVLYDDDDVGTLVGLDSVFVPYDSVRVCCLLPAAAADAAPFTGMVFSSCDLCL